jgi:DNA-binding transcriptional ArsR family regulator
MSTSKPFDVGNVTFDVQVPKFKTDAPTPVDLRTFAMVPVWAIVDPNLGHAAFRVLAAMCLFANKRTRITFVGQERLARELGVTQPSISLQIKKLREAGYIRYGRRPSSAYNQAYVIPLKAPEGPSRPNDADEYDAAKAVHVPQDLTPAVPLDEVKKLAPL